VNLGLLIGTNCLMSPLFERFPLGLIRLFKKWPFQQRTKKLKHL